MSTAAFRLRLTLALGLPLAPACSPAPEPVVPPSTAPVTTVPVRAVGAVDASVASTATTDASAPGGRCALDEIDERVCGLVSTDYAGAGGSLPAPYEHCTANGLGLWDLQTDHVLDGWKVHSHDELLASFRFDAAATAKYKYEGSYQPESPRCCYQRCNPLQALAKPRAALPAGTREYELCVPTPVGTKFPATPAKRCPAALRTRHVFPEGTIDPFDDAPFSRETDSECCYAVASKRACPPNTFQTKDGCQQPSPGGRPLRDAGGFVVAPSRTRTDWSRAIDLAGRWSPETCAHAAAAWAREAAFEHASVAAFARLSLDLMACGAPADLIDEAHVAARDEIRHAQQCYGIASAFGGSAVGPGSLAIGAVAPATSLEELAVACFRDGCVNETVAALSVAEAARRAGPPELAAAIETIAEDEMRHAELSYRILAWALREGGEPLRRRLADELARVESEAITASAAIEAPPALDETTGLLAPATAEAVRRRVLRDVVLPCTEALLRASA